MTDVEHSWVLTGVRTSRLWLGQRNHEQTGDPVQVPFDADWTINRHKEKGDVIGWYHTHPNLPAYVSTRDLATMRAWVGCLGRPLLCLIEGTRGLRGWVFEDDESMGTSIQFAQLVGNIIVGVDRDRYTRSRKAIPG